MRTNLFLDEIRMLLEVAAALFVRSTFDKPCHGLNCCVVKFSGHRFCLSKKKATKKEKKSDSQSPKWILKNV